MAVKSVSLNALSKSIEALIIARKELRKQDILHEMTNGISVKIISVTVANLNDAIEEMEFQYRELEEL